MEKDGGKKRQKSRRNNTLLRRNYKQKDKINRKMRKREIKKISLQNTGNTVGKYGCASLMNTAIHYTTNDGIGWMRQCDVWTSLYVSLFSINNKSFTNKDKAELSRKSATKE